MTKKGKPNLAKHQTVILGSTVTPMNPFAVERAINVVSHSPDDAATVIKTLRDALAPLPDEPMTAADVLLTIGHSNAEAIVQLIARMSASAARGTLFKVLCMLTLALNETDDTRDSRFAELIEAERKLTANPDVA